MKYLINFVLTCVLTSFAVAQEDWPRWRGPDLSDHSPKDYLKNGPRTAQNKFGYTRMPESDILDQQSQMVNL